MRPPIDPFERFEAVSAEDEAGHSGSTSPAEAATSASGLKADALATHASDAMKGFDAFAHDYDLDPEVAAFLNGDLGDDLITPRGDSRIKPQGLSHPRPVVAPQPAVSEPLANTKAKMPLVADEPTAVSPAMARPAANVARDLSDLDLESPLPEQLGTSYGKSSASAAAPTTPQIEADCADPFGQADQGSEPSPVIGHTASSGVSAVSIPRINIHFFLERDASLKACEAAATDRRMSRARSQVRSGGITEAIAAYALEPTPSLIIVESASDSQTLMGELALLAEVCDPSTKVVVIGAHNDIRLYRELMAQGVSEYLVGPVKTLQVIEVIAELFNDPETPFVGRMLAFVGARGGAGSSSLAHNFAYVLSEQVRANTIIVDYDLAFGTAGLDFNQDPVQGVADALSEPERLDRTLLDRMLAKCSEHLSVFSAPASLDQDYIHEADAFTEVSRMVRTSAPFIILDLPHIWTPWVKSTLVAADDVFIVATPDLASLRNAKNMIDLLRQARPNDAPPRLILNQTDMPGRPEIPLKEFTAALGVAPSVIIPFDAKIFGQAANNAQMIAQADPASRPAEALNQLASLVTGRSVAPPAKASFLASLFKKKA